MVAAIGVFLLAQGVFAPGAAAQTITATDAGYYNSLGIHDAANTNHITGVEPGLVYHGFLVFDIPAGAGFASVQLSIPTAGVDSGPNTLELYDVSTSAATVRAGAVAGPAGIAIHNDLGSGTLLGAAPGLTGSSVASVNLNAAGVAAVNAARGGPLVIGMRNGTVESAADFIFGVSAIGPIQLIATPLAPVPTLSEWAMILFGTGLAGVAGLMLWRRPRLA